MGSTHGHEGLDYLTQSLVLMLHVCSFLYILCVFLLHVVHSLAGLCGKPLLLCEKQTSCELHKEVRATQALN